MAISIRLLWIHKLSERLEKLLLGFARNGIAVVPNANLEEVLGLCDVGGLDTNNSSGLADKLPRIRK